MSTMNFKPHPYQQAAKQWVIDKPKCGLFLPMGLGKTIITLTAICELMYDRFEIDKVLIIAPIRVVKSTWPNEIRKWRHTQKLSYSMLVGDKKSRIKAARQEADIYLINRENVAWLVEYWRGAILLQINTI